ncbi:dTDP-4-dehydrorhamnose reductase [Edaphobacter aggregans]|uniref:dTDP-4-dehydrorhamnose reductase n=1 Tax=Edaphobacter aggregans TaxID=570835 RepID=UPI0005539A6D|nr:dTDP-4-dehydrorhamnose reductase [Edaphobacter aggregans]
MTERILLTGATGQVGWELAKSLAPLGEVVARGREEMDLSDATSVRERIRAVEPRWIVNPAAYTAVDKAESEPELAYAINRDAVRVIGEEARAIGAGVIHFSTDYVFEGTGITPYRETDATRPVSVYGASKLAGEEALAASGAGYLIFRTSWVYGARGKNFLLTILKAARERERLRVVADQHGAPTWSRDLARMTARAIERVEESAAGRGLSEALGPWSGVYHASGAGETTWHGFAGEAVRLARERNPEARLAEIEAITTAEYPTPARRPANSRLNCEKLAERFGWRMMDWRESLREVMKEL